MLCKKEASELQKQLKHLQSQFDLLVGQASSLIQGRKARAAVTSTINDQLSLLEEKLSERNLEVY